MIWMLLQNTQQQNVATKGINAQRNKTITQLRKFDITRTYSHQAKAKYIKDQGKEVKE